MAAPLSLSRAKITTPDAEFDKVSLIVRQNRATIRQNGTVQIDADVAVDGVARKSMTSWEITLVDGTVWQVVKARGCGCGG